MSEKFYPTFRAKCAVTGRKERDSRDQQYIFSLKNQKIGEKVASGLNFKKTGNFIRSGTDFAQ